MLAIEYDRRRLQSDRKLDPGFLEIRGQRFGRELGSGLLRVVIKHSGKERHGENCVSTWDKEGVLVFEEAVLR